jgi:phytoene dehydrogenase-like protein
MSATNKYDIIVIGAGHNGLTAAALLAKQGRKVLVLERRRIIGGVAAGEEFHPGYRTSGLLHDTSQVRAQLVNTLDLKSHGLKFIPQKPSVLALDNGERGLLLSGDVEKTANEIGPFSSRDAGQYRAYRALIERIDAVIRLIVDDVPPSMEALDYRTPWDLLKKGIALRRLGKKVMTELLRIAPMCLADWLNEWFETDFLKAAMAAPALIGNHVGPWSPGSAITLLLWECFAEHHIRGGPQSLISALERAAQNHGAQLRTESEVIELQISERRIIGVVLKGGERISVPIVAASCDPRHTFLDLVPAYHLENWMEHRIQNIRGVGTTAKVNLALNTPLDFACRSGELIEYARIGSHLDQIEKAFDASKYGRFSASPFLDIHVPTNSNPNLAPQGHSVVSILVHFIPYYIQTGWNNEQLEKLGDLVVSTLEQHAPGMSQAIVAREVLSPVDIEARYGLVKGHILHGDHALDQLIVRPTPECARYSTPLKGLYLCGSGSHPGGGITCEPGALAASVIAQA